jgi:hypothetical protein
MSVYSAQTAETGTPPALIREGLLDLAHDIAGAVVGDQLSPNDGTTWEPAILSGLTPYIPIPRKAELVAVIRYAGQNRRRDELQRVTYHAPSLDLALQVVPDTRADIYADEEYVHLLQLGHQLLQRSQAVAAQAFVGEQPLPVPRRGEIVNVQIDTKKPYKELRIL